MDEQGLGHRLQVARQAAGLTQQELCQKAGIAYSTLAKIERGAIKAPSVFTICQIAEVLGVSLDNLLGVTPGASGMGTTAPAKQYGRSKTGVTFVYFDVNGCLVHFFNRAFTKMAADFGASPDTIETIFWHYNDAVCRGELGLHEFNRLTAEKLGVASINWLDYYIRTIEPVVETRELLKWAAENYRIGLLSNIMPGFIEAMIERDIIPRLDYAAIVDSSKAGAIKPEPHMYEIAQERAGVSGNEILFIDDSRANLMAAERFGWHVLWFDDFQPAESVARVRGALELAGPTQAAPSQSLPSQQAPQTPSRHVLSQDMAPVPVTASNPYEMPQNRY
jgi:FMN phosphatase YigB (HAD superfamily)/transcriptional regulator with XRE-family HTH domain